MAVAQQDPDGGIPQSRGGMCCDHGEKVMSVVPGAARPLAGDRARAPSCDWPLHVRLTIVHVLAEIRVRCAAP